MEPIKSLVPLAKWLLRIALMLTVYSLYFDTAIEFSFDSANYFISLATVIFAVTLFLGGFLKKATLTVTSGFIIFLLSIILMFTGGISVNAVFTNFGPAALGFYFMARGNRG